MSLETLHMNDNVNEDTYRATRIKMIPKKDLTYALKEFTFC